MLRADAGPSVGFGHAMRSITLGGELAAQGSDVTWAYFEAPDQLLDRARHRAIEPVRLPSLHSLDGITGVGANCVVVDGYRLGPVCELLSRARTRLAIVDDNRELPVDIADLVVNQNAFASARSLYPDLNAEFVLAGADYALIRSDVTAITRRDSVRETVGRVLVTLGGADPLRLSAPVSEQLAAALPGLEVCVAAGPGHPQRAELVDLDRSQIEVRLATPGLLDEFSSADLAVIGAGTTLWENAYLGMPTVAVVTADNQQEGAAAAAAAGFAVVVDARRAGIEAVVEAVTIVAESPTLRDQMRLAGQSLIDGQGAHRTAAKLAECVTTVW